MCLQLRWVRAPLRFPVYAPSLREGARARPDGPAWRDTSNTPPASATSPAAWACTGSRPIHVCEPRAYFDNSPWVLHSFPPGCCASPALAGRHKAAGPRRLPTLLSRGAAPSPDPGRPPACCAPVGVFSTAWSSSSSFDRDATEGVTLRQAQDVVVIIRKSSGSSDARAFRAVKHKFTVHARQRNIVDGNFKDCEQISYIFRGHLYYGSSRAIF